MGKTSSGIIKIALAIGTVVATLIGVKKQTNKK